MDESIWIGVVFIALFIAAEMVPWVRNEYNKWLSRKRVQSQ